ncbi:hypothetical protein [Nonomuraea sp. bgisy101]
MLQAEIAQVVVPARGDQQPLGRDGAVGEQDAEAVAVVLDPLGPAPRCAL